MSTPHLNLYVCLACVLRSTGCAVISHKKEVAEQSGIGLTTIHKFENGISGNLSLATFILLLKVVGQVNALDDLLPELPESPYLMRKEEKKAQRIRHKK